jgi:hypothetical protein
MQTTERQNNMQHKLFKLQEEFDDLTAKYLKLRNQYDLKVQVCHHLAQKNHDLAVQVRSLKQAQDPLLSGDLIFTLKKRIETLERFAEGK